MSALALESGGPPSLAALCLARLARGAPQRVLLTILRCVCMCVRELVMAAKTAGR